MKTFSAFLMQAALLAALSFGAPTAASTQCNKGQCPRDGAACCKTQNCCKDGKCTKAECCQQGQCTSACCKKQ